MATIKDVAELAGVSIATVSNYLNRTKPVTQKTQIKISKAIEHLSYVPNYSAKTLKANSYNDVGVILPNFNDSYYVQIFKGIEKELQDTNYFVNLSFSNNISDIETKLLKNFIRKNVCGFILVTCQPENSDFLYNHLIAKNIPTVFLDRSVKDIYTNFISFDNRKTVKYITSQLISQGYNNIALLIGPKEYYCENECVEGYKAAFAEHNITFKKEYIYHTNLNKEDAFRLTTLMLSSLTPEVIITSSESNAKGIIESLTLLKYRVPEDVMVISLGEEHWNQYTCSVSTINSIRQAMNMGEQAAKMLKEQIHTPRTFESQRILLEDRMLFSDPPDFRLIQKKNKYSVLKQRDTLNVLMLETPQVNAFEGLIPQFEKTTGIKVNLTKKPHQHLLKTIEKEHSDEKTNDNVSDVYMFDIPWLYHLASDKILEDISDEISDPEFDENVFLDESLTYFSKFEGKYYGLPFMYAPQIFYYRKDLFEDRKIVAEYQSRHNIRLRPPRTWAEFNAISKFFTKKINPSSPVEYGTSIPAAYVECLLPEIYMRLWSFGGKIFDKRNKVVFDSPQTLKTYSSFFNSFDYVAPNYLESDDVSVAYDFMNGKTAMLITYPSFLNEIIDLQKSGICGKIGYDIIPGSTPLLGGWSLGINSLTAKRSLAFEFIKWACGETIANYFTLLEGQSAIKNVFKNDELTKLYPWLPLYYSVYKYTKPVIPPYQKGKAVIPQDMLEKIVSKWIYEIIKDNVTIPKAIKNTHLELVELFESYGYSQN